MSPKNPKINLLTDKSQDFKTQLKHMEQMTKLEHEHEDREKEREHRREFFMTCCKGISLLIVTIGCMVGFLYVCTREAEIITKFIPIITAILGYVSGRLPKS